MDSTPGLKRKRFGDVLKEIGLINDEQLQMGLKYQKANPKKRLGSCFVELGYLTEPQMLRGLAKALDIQYIDIASYPVSLDAVRKIPRSVAQKYGALAVEQKGDTLVVAMNDPLNFYSIDDIKIVANMDVEVVVAQERKINEAISFYYAETETRTAVDRAEDDFDRPILSSVDAEDESASMIKLLNSLLVKGYVSGASDVHIEPFEKHTKIRMRVDGMLMEYTTLPKAMHQALIARIKIMSGMDIAEKRLPQDGHGKLNTGGYEMSLRISSIPTVYGEKAVIRYLSAERQVDNSESFGMEIQNAKKLQKLLDSPYGIVYITGPTGSGKTTTLYMALEYLSNRKVNISTIEEPVERNIPKVTQMQVNNTVGVTFERGLRALLRQDPDIIMVGETRDRETAEISVRAAITGHLVLSTLHTNDALSAIVRLQDMGVEPYLLSSALNGIVAQRLVKKICRSCIEEYTPDGNEAVILGDDVDKVYRGRGCHVCGNTGYKGRIAIHEILFVDKTMRQMITRRESLDVLEKYVRENQDFVTLKDNLISLVMDGTTTAEELMRLTYFVE